MVNMVQMMAKAKQFKEKMEDLQARIHVTEFTGSAAGGAVTARVTGKLRPLSVHVQETLWAEEEKDVILDLIVAAINHANDQVATVMSDETRQLMEDVGLPPGLEFPF